MKPTYTCLRKCPRTHLRFVLGTFLMKLAPGELVGSQVSDRFPLGYLFRNSVFQATVHIYFFFHEDLAIYSSDIYCKSTFSPE